MTSKSFFRLLTVFYILISVGLFFYSFTQVDLNLTISQASILQFIQKEFQSLGYFHRAQSTILYICLLLGFFILYAISLWGVAVKRLSTSHIWKLICIVSVLLIFSYPAFSYDIYNYMFTAKTIVVYHKNPYEVIPLQFSGIEPWLSFMRWTHLPSAYTPIWIILTVPAYIFGFGFFLPVLWNIKLLALAMFLITTKYIEKIVTEVDPEYRGLSVAIFGLNPLIIYETLVSGHNDIAMMATAMIALYVYINRHAWISYGVLSLSVATKLMTIFLLPLYLFRWNRQLALYAIVGGLVLVLFTRDILPWYFVWIMPFVALLPRSKGTLYIAIAASFGLLLRYVPYLYLGNWDPPALAIENTVTLIPIGISIAYIWLKRRIKTATFT